MLASGLGVYRFVIIGKISRAQHQLVRPHRPRAMLGDVIGQGTRIQCWFSLGGFNLILTYTQKSAFLVDHVFQIITHNGIVHFFTNLGKRV